MSQYSNSPDPRERDIQIVQQELEAKLALASPDWWPDTREWAEQIVRALWIDAPAPQ